MRLDAVSEPSIGAVTLNFKLDKKDALATKILLNHDNLQVALSMATDPAVTRTSDTNIVYQLCQIRSKFDADNAYSLCRASGPFTKSHVCQPCTIFTLADYDCGTSPLSSLFRQMATIVLRLGVRATLAKATVESCLVQGNLDTQNASTAIIALYGDSNEIIERISTDIVHNLSSFATSILLWFQDDHQQEEFKEKFNELQELTNLQLQSLNLLPFRKMRFSTKIYSKQNDENLVKGLKRKFGEDCVLVFGN